MKKKIISMLLILSLVIQCLPATAFAGKTPEEIKNEAKNGIAIEKYDNGERTINFATWVVSGYELDTSQFVDSGHMSIEDKSNLLIKDAESNPTLDWSSKTVKFKVKDTDVDTNKIKFTIPLKKTDQAVDKYNIVFNVTIKNTKIKEIGSYDGDSNGFKYSAKQLQIKKGPKTTTGSENTVFYEFTGDESDLASKKIIIEEEWYNRDEQYKLVGAPPINVGKYDLIILVKDAKTGNVIAKTKDRVKVDINKKPVKLINLAAYTKPYDGNKSATLNYDAARISDTVGGETIKISEASKKVVKAEFENPYVGKDKNVKLSIDKKSAPLFELINGTGLASNYTLEAPVVKGEIQSVKRTIDLKEPIDAAQNRLIVPAQQSVDAVAFKKILEGAITDECLANLKKQSNNLEFYFIKNGQEVNLQGEKIELGKTYRIRVKAPNIDENGDASPSNVNLNEYIGDTKDFTIIAKEEAKKITITKSDKIEYTGNPVNVTENKGTAENGLNFQFDGARPFYAWYEKNGAGWKQLSDRPIKPGSYKVEATSSSAGQVGVKASETFEIVKKGIGVQSVEVSNKIFANNNDSANVLEVTLDDNSTLDSSKYSIIDATFTDFNVGADKKIDLTIALRDEGAECYMFKENNSSIISLKGIKASSGEILEATFPGTSNEKPLEINVKAKPGVQSYLDLTDYLCHDFKIEETKIVSGDKFEGGQWKPILATESKGIKFKLKDNAADTEGDSTITIPVESKNYRDYKIIINVTPERLEVPKVLFRVSDRIIYDGGKKITFDKVEWGQSFSPIVNNGVEYMYSGNVTPQIKWYEADGSGSFDSSVATTNVPTKAGTYKVELSFAGNTSQAGVTVSKFVIVEERIANITDFQLSKKVYDKSNKGDASNITSIVFKDSIGNAITDIKKDDTNGYSVEYISYGKSEVGKDIPVTIKIHLNGTAAKNYTLKRDTFTANRGEIVKAKNIVDPIVAKTPIGQQGSVDLSTVITDNANISIDLQGSNDIFKYVKYEGEEQEKPVNIIDNKLVYTIKDVEHIGSKKSGKVILNVNDPNYEPYTITITITAVSRETQKPLFITSGNALKFGEELKLSYEGGSPDATGKVTFAIKPGGTGAASIRENPADNSFYLVPIEKGTVDVIATKEADDVYAEVQSAPKRITISQGIARGEPTFTPIGKPGVKLSSVVLGSEKMIPSGGTFKWSSSTTTIVEKGKAYKWQYEPSEKDKDHYKGTTGEVILYTEDSSDAYVTDIQLPDVPSAVAGQEFIGMTATQKTENTNIIKELAEDIRKGKEHTVPADSVTKATEKKMKEAYEKGKKVIINVKTSSTADSKDVDTIKRLLDTTHGKDKYTIVKKGTIKVTAETEESYLGLLNELDSKLAFTIQLPKGAYGEDYRIARMHLNKAELLEPSDVSQLNSSKQITFYADRFSTYVLYRLGDGGGDTGSDDSDKPIDPDKPVDPDDPYDPNNPDADSSGYNPKVKPVTNIKLTTDFGLIRATYTKSPTKYVKFYRFAYRPVKKCTCGRWHVLGKWDYAATYGTSGILKVKKYQAYQVKITTVTKYGRGSYVSAGIVYANRTGTSPGKMYTPQVIKLYSKGGAVKVTARDIRYKTSPQRVTYRYAYRLKGSKKWHYYDSYSNVKTFKGFKKGRIYEFRVAYYYKSRVSSKIYVKSSYSSGKYVKIR